MSVLDLTTTKEHLNISATADDGELQRTIDKAEAAVATRVGPLAATTSTVVITVDGASDVLVLPTRSVAGGLTSVATFAGDVTDLTTLYLDPAAGLVYTVDGTRAFSGRYVVTYQAGFASVPDDVVGAIEELVRHLWQTQRGSGNRPGPRPSSEVANSLPGSAYSFPIRVEQMLEPYRSPQVA